MQAEVFQFPEKTDTTKQNVRTELSSGISSGAGIISTKDTHNGTSSVIITRIIGPEKKQVKGSDNMDDSTKLLLDRMDKDMREHKQEIRDRDARLQSEFQERENRIHNESKEREERFTKQVSDLFDNHQKLIDQKLSHLDTKISNIDGAISGLRDELKHVTDRVDSMHDRVGNTKLFIIGSVVTILLGIAGIVYANWQIIAAMLEMSNK